MYLYLRYMGVAGLEARLGASAQSPLLKVDPALVFVFVFVFVFVILFVFVFIFVFVFALYGCGRPRGAAQSAQSPLLCYNPALVARGAGWGKHSV